MGWRGSMIRESRSTNSRRHLVCVTPTSNAMRPSGQTSGDLIALVDSDIVLPRDWMSRAVTALVDSGSSCVAGGMKSVHHSFWGRYTDSTWIGAKTPRIKQSYTVTRSNFGARGRKPPITANTLFTRELYENCPIDPSWSHGSYEDYEWFWRVTTAGSDILVCRDLFGWHDHRRGMRALVKEYRRSSRGCAYFIRAHRDCPFAKRRLRQLFILPLAAIVSAAAAAAAVAAGHGIALAALLLGGTAVLTVHQISRSRNLESIAYPVVGLVLGLVFITGLAMNLIGSARAGAVAETPAQASGTKEGQSLRRLRRLSSNNSHLRTAASPFANSCTEQYSIFRRSRLPLDWASGDRSLATRNIMAVSVCLSGTLWITDYLSSPRCSCR